MTPGKLEIKNGNKELRKLRETFTGAAQAAYDATATLTGSTKQTASDKKK
jgi:hypothetical protein